MIHITIISGSIRQSRNSHRVSLSLNTLLNQGSVTSSSIIDLAAEGVPLLNDLWDKHPEYNEAFQNRPDIQQKQLFIELNKNILSQSRSMRMPTVSLVGAYQIQAQADNLKFDSYKWPKTSFVGLQANIHLFSGNRINTKIRQSAIQLEKSEIEYTDAKDNAQTQIVTLENNLKEVFQRLAIQKKSVEAAQMNFTIVNDRYKNGLSSRLELSDAELVLTDAKMNQLYSIFNVKIAKLQLDKALGVLQY